MALNNPILDASLNHISLEQIKKEKGPPPWSHSVVLADHVGGTVIYQNSGQVNDRHCHDYDEWWVVLEGEIDWIIEGREDRPVNAKAGDFVFVPSQTFHHIFPKGDGPSIRLGIALPGHGHLHEKPEAKARIRIESGGDG
ncbi:MAG: cupin domain-containing protein [Planctomycetota bacterium]|nr:cupin domain-containing protein [Planctomycetota bacterium]